jgi:hypothetical protein
VYCSTCESIAIHSERDVFVERLAPGSEFSTGRTRLSPTLSPTFPLAVTAPWHITRATLGAAGFLIENPLKGGQIASSKPDPIVLFSNRQ